MSLRMLTATLTLLACLAIQPGCHLIFPFDLSSQGSADADLGLSLDFGASDRQEPVDGDVDRPSQGDAKTADVGLPKQDAGSNTLVPSWAKGLGSIGIDRAYGVAVGPLGDVYIVGSSVGSFTVDGKQVTGKGLDDGFIISLDPKGAYSWHRVLGGSSTDEAAAVAVDNNGYVYVTGRFTGTVDFGGGSRDSKSVLADVFVASYAPDGTYRWDRAFGGSGGDTGVDLAVDGNGTSYVTGRHGSATSLDSYPLDYAGGGDLFVASFTSMGSARWAHAFGGPELDEPRGIAVDAQSNVYVTGSFRNSVDFGSGPLTSAGNTDIFLLSLSYAGAYRWSKRFGGVHGEVGADVTTGPSPNNQVFVTGTFASAIDLDGSGSNTLKGNSLDDLFIASYTSGGVYIRADVYGGKTYDAPRGLVVDGMGNVLLVGDFTTSADFGGGLLTTAGFSDVFVASYGPNGAHLWSERFGGPAIEEGHDVASGPGGVVYVVGSFTSPSIAFGNTTLTSNGLEDAFVVKLAPSP